MPKGFSASALSSPFSSSFSAVRARFEGLSKKDADPRGPKGAAAEAPGREQQSALPTSKQANSHSLNALLTSGGPNPNAKMFKRKPVPSRGNSADRPDAEQPRIGSEGRQDDGSSDARQNDEPGGAAGHGAKADQAKPAPLNTLGGLPTPASSEPPSPVLSDASLPSYQTEPDEVGAEAAAPARRPDAGPGHIDLGRAPQHAPAAQELTPPPTPVAEEPPALASPGHAPSQAGAAAPAAAAAAPEGGAAKAGDVAARIKVKLPDLPAGIAERLGRIAEQDLEKLASDLKDGKDPAAAESDAMARVDQHIDEHFGKAPPTSEKASMDRMETHLEKQMKMQEMQLVFQMKKEIMEIINNFIKSTIQAWKLSGQ